MCSSDLSARPKVEASHAAVKRILASGKAAYGINTGFGRLSQTRIADSELDSTIFKPPSNRLPKNNSAPCSNNGSRAPAPRNLRSET